MAVAGNGTANDCEDIFLAAVRQIGKGDAVSLVQFTSPRRLSYVGEIFSVVVTEQDVGLAAITGVAVAEIDIQEAVVIYIAKVGAHGHKNFVETGLCTHVTEDAVAHILVELHAGGIVRQAQIGARNLIDRCVELVRKRSGQPSLS